MQRATPLKQQPRAQPNARAVSTMTKKTQPDPTPNFDHLVQVLPGSLAPGSSTAGTGSLPDQRLKPAAWQFKLESGAKTLAGGDSTKGSQAMKCMLQGNQAAFASHV